MKIAFIGLGNLGKAIAGRLMECGHELVLYNRTRDKAEGLGAPVAPSAREAVEQAELVCLCLFDSNAVRQVLTAEDGVLAASQGKIVMDITTNHFEDAAEFHQVCAKQGTDYLEAPVLGSVIPASQGALTLLAGGRKEAFEKALPVMEDMAKHVFHLEEPGLASKMKLINNLTLGSFMATIAEAVALGEEVGIERGKVLDILSVGGGNSLVLNAKKAKLKDLDFSTHFSNALIYKDLHCLQDLAYQCKRPLFTAAAVKELYARTFLQGIEHEDFSAVYKVVRGQEGP